MFSVSIYYHWPLVLLIQAASNCQLLALNVAVVHGLLHIVDKVHGCFVLVKEFKSSTCICVQLSHVCEHSPVLQGMQVVKI